jgi:hypothetical protein
VSDTPLTAAKHEAICSDMLRDGFPYMYMKEHAQRMERDRAVLLKALTAIADNVDVIRAAIAQVEAKDE